MKISDNLFSVHIKILINIKINKLKFLHRLQKIALNLLQLEELSRKFQNKHTSSNIINDIVLFLKFYAIYFLL